jgi:hypothetical protein
VTPLRARLRVAPGETLEPGDRIVPCGSWTARKFVPGRDDGFLRSDVIGTVIGAAPPDEDGTHQVWALI